MGVVPIRRVASGERERKGQCHAPTSVSPPRPSFCLGCSSATSASAVPLLPDFGAARFDPRARDRQRYFPLLPGMFNMLKPRAWTRMASRSARAPSAASPARAEDPRVRRPPCSTRPSRTACWSKGQETISPRIPRQRLVPRRGRHELPLRRRRKSHRQGRSIRLAGRTQRRGAGLHHADLEEDRVHLLPGACARGRGARLRKTFALLKSLTVTGITYSNVLQVFERSGPSRWRATSNTTPPASA